MATLPNHMVKVKRNMAEKKKMKRKHIRWGDDITLTLIRKVLECVKDSPDSFEKPTAQRFYERLATGCTRLNGIPWACMREKMRHCKNSFITINTWKQQTDNGTKANGDIKYVDDYVERKCPHYDELNKIFGQQIKFEEHLCNAHDETPITTPPLVYTSEEVSDTDHSLSFSYEDTNQTLEELPEISDIFSSIGYNEQEYKNQPKSQQMNNSCLTMMQQELMKLKRDKFKWQKQKEQQQLDNDFKIKQMELEQNERLKKFEFELKYKKNNKNT